MSEIVQRLKPEGYCAGVSYALNTLLRYQKDHPEQQITLFGPLVHNQYVVEALQKIGIQTFPVGPDKAASLSEIKQGTVVFSAHGISDALKEQALAQNLEVLDLSCPFVLQNRKEIVQKLKEGYEVLYLGKRGHPETEAVLSISPAVHLIESPADFPELEVPVYLTNQTTFSLMDLQTLMKEARIRYPGIEIGREVCNATRLRQEKVMNTDPSEVDGLVVVGDIRSHNTQKLAQIARQSGFKNVWSLQDASEIPAELYQMRKLALISGASTPAAISDQVSASLLDQPYLLDSKQILKPDQEAGLELASSFTRD